MIDVCLVFMKNQHTVPANYILDILVRRSKTKTSDSNVSIFTEYDFGTVMAEFLR